VTGVVRQELPEGTLMGGVGLRQEGVPGLRDAVPLEVVRDEVGAVAREVAHHQGPQREREVLPRRGEQGLGEVFGHRRASSASSRQTHSLPSIGPSCR